MAQAPQIDLRDGSGTTQYLDYTTDQSFTAISGKIPLNTVDLQVSVNGGAWTSDATLVYLDSGTFRVPNPTAYPDGIPLDLGVNTVQMRAIDILGGVSAPSVVQATRVSRLTEYDYLIPTGIRLHRRRDTVEIHVAKTDTQTTLMGGYLSGLEMPLEFRGFNFYAASTAGGPYLRVNDSPVSAVVTQEEDLETLDTRQTDFLVEGRNVRIRVEQEDQFGALQVTNLNTVVETARYDSDFRFSSTLQLVRHQDYVSWRHDRHPYGNVVEGNQANTDAWVGVPTNQELYYVITGTYYDPNRNQEFETAYSQEVVGAPVVLDTSIKDLPGRTANQISLAFIQAIQGVDQEISLLPGSSTRDVSIDPFASEAERVWFLVDFVHRSQSFLTLLQIDDADQDGVSDPISGSAYKQALKAALGFTSDTAVQQLLDTQFDKLAKNQGKTRLAGRPASGQAVFYSATRPTKDLTVPSGTQVSTNTSGSSQAYFQVGGTFVLPAAQADAYYNFDTQRYELTTDILALQVGSAGNQPAGTITQVQGNVGGLKVTNTEATTFGRDRESNTDLAVRAQVAYTSVDTGTEGGYYLNAIETTGVVKTKVVKSGDPLMMRDYDPVRKKHIGGKVDVWIQGLRERTVTEKFSFTFTVARDTRCQVMSAAGLTFAAILPGLSVDTPIIEVLAVRNVSLGQDYDLTGVSISDYKTIQLSSLVPQPATALDDVITADFRYRSINQFVFGLQPVRRVVSVQGEVSGTIQPTTGWNLYKTDDPLLEGESTLAKDHLVITQVGGIPAGTALTVNAEAHVLIGFFEQPLGSVGINPLTLRVFSQDRLTEYQGPEEAIPDYDIISATSTSPIKVVRTTNSQIVSGQTVSVDYQHDENFTVQYVVNDLLQQLQRTLNIKRHTTADALVKQAVLNSANMESTVQLKRGATKDTVDPLARTNVSADFNSRTIGQGIAQSDFIRDIDATQGVDFQVLPLARMGYQDGARRIREPVAEAAIRIPGLDSGATKVYCFNSPLRYPTTDGGGLATEHRGVFRDDIALQMSPTLLDVGLLVDQSWIIGAAGAVVPGYSDDLTLTAAGFITATAIANERLARTANRVLVSLSGSGIPLDVPEAHVWAVSYAVRNDRGPHDLEATQVEWLDLGSLTLTFREAV